MRKLLLMSVAFSVMAFALSGCGGGGRDASSPEMFTAALPAATYLPLAVGNWWHYRIGATAALEILQFTGTTTLGRATFYAAKVTRPRGGTPTLKAGLYLQASDGLHFRATSTATDALILKPPFTAGATWSSGGRTFKIAQTGVVVNTPAGEFGSCVVVEETVSGKKIRTAYASGLGIVQVTQDTTTLLGLDATSLQGSGVFISSQLTQQAPGAAPLVRLTLKLPANKETLHGVLVFRAANSSNVPVDATHLVDMLQGLLTAYNDDPTRHDVTTGQVMTFQYLSGGTQKVGTVTATFNHPAMVPGARYYHRVKSIIDPPAATMGLAQAKVTPSLVGNPPSLLTGPVSNASGPLTYFNPPLLVVPVNGSANQPTSDITLSWQATTGANQYIVQVFPATDPDGRGTPAFSSAVINSTAASILSTVITGPFSAATQYYWRVGAHQSTDPIQPLNLLTGQTGWLFSSMRQFTTATPAPPPPGG